jgi:hypothetical protein
MRKAFRRPGIFGLLGALFVCLSALWAPVLGQDESPSSDLQPLKNALASVKKESIPDIFFSIPERERMLYPIHTEGPPSPLQRFAIRELRLKATFVASQPMAIVATPEGNSYIVRPKEPIGPFGGVVTAIERGKLVITERYYTYDRKIKEIQRELRMPQDEQRTLIGRTR